MSIVKLFIGIAVLASPCAYDTDPRDASPLAALTVNVPAAQRPALPENIALTSSQTNR